VLTLLSLKITPGVTPKSNGAIVKPINAALVSPKLMRAALKLAGAVWLAARLAEGG
jgi:hypothetical protein